MGNAVANAIAQGGPTYTGVSCLKLNWLWSSPLAIVWQIATTVISLAWLVVRLIIELLLATFRSIGAVILGWKIFVWWAIFIVISLVWWMIFPSVTEILEELAPGIIQAIATVVSLINMMVDLYNFIVIIWNSFYPLIGFFLYIYLDIILMFAYELIGILGEPAIGQLMFLVVEQKFALMNLGLAILQPLLRFLPIIMTALVAQIGPMIQIVADVIPFLFPIVSWLLGIVFFVLGPILTLIVWAVNKVKSFFGARRSARSLLSVGMSGLLLTRDMLSSMVNGAPGAAVASSVHAQQMQQALDNATANSTDYDFSLPAELVRHLLEAPRSSLPQDQPLDNPAHQAPDIHIPSVHVAEQAQWATPDTESQGDQEPLPGLHEQDFWVGVGQAGSKLWGGTFSYEAARKELAGITDYLQRHPHASYEYMAAEQASWLQAELYNSANTPLVVNMENGMAVHQTRNVLDYSSAAAAAAENATIRAPWFAGSSSLESSLLLEVLQRECEQTPQAAHCISSEEEDRRRDPSTYRPATMPHHRHIRMATVLGTPLHMQTAETLDPLDIERRHAELAHQTSYTNYNRVRAEIEKDVAAGHHLECQGSPACGGPGAKMAHPSYTLRRRHVVRKHTGPAYDDMEAAKSRHIYTDALEHGVGTSIHRYETVHSHNAQRVWDHHASAILGRFTGMTSLVHAVDHYNANFSSFQDVHHNLNRALAARPWFPALRNTDRHRHTRPFYDEWADHQVFHLVTEPDITHGHPRPKIYVELQQAPTSRKTLYTLELFDFLSDLDCYTTTPRAPLCLPDPFPDNWHLTPDRFPGMNWLEEFVDPDEPIRCYCAQFICALPRRWIKVFPWIDNSNYWWPINPLYVIGPCQLYNIAAFFIMLFNFFFVEAFLRLASLLVRYWWLEPLVSWVFIIPAGSRPNARAMWCFFGEIFTFVVVFFLCWWAGVVLKPYWNWFVHSIQAVPQWISVRVAAREGYWGRIEKSQEAVFYNEAYESNLNSGKMLYNDPTLAHTNSLGVWSPTAPMTADQRDQLSYGDGGTNFADQQARFGVGNGRIPYMTGLPQGSRTMWESARTEQQHRLNSFGEPRPAPDLTTPYNDVVQPELSLLGSNIGAPQPYLDASPPDDSSELAQLMSQYANVNDLIAARQEAMAMFGVAPVHVTSHMYDVWRSLFGWVLMSHHFSDLHLQQVSYHRRKIRKYYRRNPWAGPGAAPRRDPKKDKDSEK